MAAEYRIVTWVNAGNQELIQTVTEQINAYVAEGFEIEYHGFACTGLLSHADVIMVRRDIKIGNIAPNDIQEAIRSGRLSLPDLQQWIRTMFEETKPYIPGSQ